jgi:hypothetical protein
LIADFEQGYPKLGIKEVLSLIAENTVSPFVSVDGSSLALRIADFVKKK